MTDSDAVGERSQDGHLSPAVAAPADEDRTGTPTTEQGQTSISPDVGPIPAVSVVLINYNDARRLRGAIRSVTRQSLSGIEIIIVDHGSTDRSVEIARNRAADDSRIRVIALGDNEGKPGRPINAGIAAARAPWVTVFASDDRMNERACEVLLEAAHKDRADIVVGSLHRINMDTGEKARWMPDVTLRPRVVTDLSQFPDLIRDTTGGGKLYSTDFVRKHGLIFPEDIYYQDQAFTLQYYALADRVSIIPDFVVRWRHWPSSARQSVTQRRLTVENLSDRFEVNRRIDEFLRDLGRRDILAIKQRKFITHDLTVHIRGASGASAEYRDLLVGRTREYVAGFLPESLQGVPLSRWLTVLALRSGRLADAERAGASHFTELVADSERERIGGRQCLLPPWLGGSHDDVFDVTRYRLEDIPPSFAPVRGFVTVRSQRRGLGVDVCLQGSDRAAASAAEPAELALVDRDTGRCARFALKHSGGATWAARLPFPALDRSLDVGEGKYELIAVMRRGSPAEFTVRLRPDEQHDDADTERARWLTTSQDLSVLLHRAPLFTRRERTEQNLRERFDRLPQPVPDPSEMLTLDQAHEYLADRRHLARPRTASFESFAGRRVAEGPLAVSRALSRRRRDVEQHWSHLPWSVLEVPRRTTGAARFSRAHLDALARSSVWVDNGWLPFDPDGRALVQLWHGTPLRRLEPTDEPARWTHLVSSGPAFEQRIGEAHKHGAEILPLGGPRTDALVGQAARQRRAQVRRAWGLQERTVVFYCPTLRDGAAAQEYRSPDLHRMAAVLGDDHFWFHREHDDDVTGRRAQGVPDDLRWFAAGVNARRELTDYLLASDILVSDYSTHVLDYGLTGRTVLHHVPDLRHIEQSHPGVYTSLTEAAAGPVVLDDTELVTALRDRSGGTEQSRAYATELAPLDARASADLVVEAIDW